MRGGLTWAKWVTLAFLVLALVRELFGTGLLVGR